MKPLASVVLSLVLAAVLTPAAARDTSLVGAWKLDNLATLDHIRRTRHLQPEAVDNLRRLYRGTVLCTFTPATWLCEASGNPHRPDWSRGGGYRLLSGDGVYKVAEFDVSTADLADATAEPVQQGVALLRPTADGYWLYRPDLDYWQFFRRVR